jgi:hypothetical protein
MVSMARALTFLASLPERLVRSIAATLGGAVHETAALALPRFVRHSRLYEATARNMLRILVELVGGVVGSSTVVEAGPDAGELAKRKAAGNIVELGSIAAVGFSPLWLLAAASDVVHGSRVYLDVLVEELKAAGVLSEASHAETVDDLLAALEGTSRRAALLIDIPPIALAELRLSLRELRSSADELPTRDELARAYEGLLREATAERRSLLEVGSGMALAFVLSARSVGRTHVTAPYREDWRPLRDEGFAAYARRIAEPYRQAVLAHLDPERSTFTERGVERVRRGGREAGADGTS